MGAELVVSIDVGAFSDLPIVTRLELEEGATTGHCILWPLK